MAAPQTVLDLQFERVRCTGLREIAGQTQVAEVLCFMMKEPGRTWRVCCKNGEALASFGNISPNMGALINAPPLSKSSSRSSFASEVSI